MEDTLRTTPRWAVAATVDDPAPLVLAWVAHHLRVGAHHVFVFLDRPDDALSTVLGALPQVTVTVCDDAYWAHSTHRARPIRFSVREAYNAARLQNEAGVDWVIPTEVSAFLDPGPEFLSDLAKAQSARVALPLKEHVRVGRVHSIFDGSFRQRAGPPRGADWIYGRWAGYLNAGLASPKDRAPAIRVGQDDRSDPQPAPIDATVRYYNGMTPLHTILRILKRSRERRSLMAAASQTYLDRQTRFVHMNLARPVQMRRMIDGVFGVNPTQAKALGDGFVDEIFDPNCALAALGLDADLTSDTFDGLLRDRHDDIIAKAGLRF